jgi:serine/threonine-protein kinase RsbW
VISGAGGGGMPEQHGETAGPVTVSVVNDRGEIERTEAAILERIDQHEFPKACRFAVKLAFEEAIANAFQHGHRDLPGDTPVRVTYAVSEDEIRIDVEDQGPGFNSGDIPDPTLDENLDRPSGRGLMLMRCYMTSVNYNERGNRVEMVYRRTAPATSS